MFERFGEFDSAQEINRAAAAQLAEGDLEAVRMIAQENGIAPEDAQDYLDGAVSELCNDLMAAMGKLDVEEADLKPEGLMEDWLAYIRMQCTESLDMAAAVRRKGKSVRECIAKLMVYSFQNAKPVDEKILKAAKIPGRVTFGVPGMAKARKLIRDYYMGG